MNKNLKELLKLIEENPDLEVVVMVQSEVVGGDIYGRWLGSFGKIEIDKYVTSKEYNEPGIFFHSHKEYEDAIAIIAPDIYEHITEYTLEEIKEEFEKLPWVEAIIVNIDLPDSV